MKKTQPSHGKNVSICFSKNPSKCNLSRQYSTFCYVNIKISNLIRKYTNFPFQKICHSELVLKKCIKKEEKCGCFLSKSRLQFHEKSLTIEQNMSLTGSSAGVLEFGELGRSRMTQLLDHDDGRHAVPASVPHRTG